MGVREQPQSIIPIAGELWGKLKNIEGQDSLTVSSLTDGIEAVDKPIEEVLILNPQAKELFLMMCGKIASAVLPVGNLGMHVLNTPQQESVEIIGTNNNRDSEGRPQSSNEISLTLLDAQKIARDELTGAYNRSVLISKMEALQSTGIPFSVLMGDMDRFKSINDTYGHIAGDKSLQELAQRMTACLRTGHTGDLSKKQNRINDSVIGRFGGDEFIALLPNCSPEGLVSVQNRLNDSLISYNEQAKDKGEAEISISMAGASLGELPQGTNISELINLADKRMFNIKMEKRLGNVGGIAEQYLGSDITEKISLLKSMLKEVDFSFSKMLPSQIVITAINDYLLEFTEREIIHNSQTGDINKISPLLKLRSGIPSALGIREDTGIRENFQIILNKTSEILLDEVYGGARSLSKKEKIIKLANLAETCPDNLQLQMLTNAIFELNKQPLTEV